MVREPGVTDIAEVSYGLIARDFDKILLSRNKIPRFLSLHSFTSQGEEIIFSGMSHRF